MQTLFKNVPPQMRGLLLLVGTLALIIAAYFLTEDATTSMQIILIGSIIGIGLMIGFLLWKFAGYDESRSPPVEQPEKAVIPLEALPPYQPIRQEPTITIQIPARTVVALVLGLVILSMIYIRVFRDDRG